MSPVRTASKPMALRDTAPDTISASLVDRVTPEFDEKIGGLPSDREFVAMRAAYQATVGTARGDDLARLMADHRRGASVSHFFGEITCVNYGQPWQRWLR